MPQSARSWGKTATITSVNMSQIALNQVHIYCNTSVTKWPSPFSFRNVDSKGLEVSS